MESNPKDLEDMFHHAALYLEETMARIEKRYPAKPSITTIRGLRAYAQCFLKTGATILDRKGQNVSLKLIDSYRPMVFPSIKD